MATYRLPFCATQELQAPFVLDEAPVLPVTGVKNIMMDKTKLQFAAKYEDVAVPDMGIVKMCIFYLVGTIPYICSAYPIVPSLLGEDVQQYSADFSDATPSSECVETAEVDALQTISTVGCLNVDLPCGGSCNIADMPSMSDVTISIEDFAVANNLTSGLVPTCGTCGEEEKRVIKWRGCLVVELPDPPTP